MPHSNNSFNKELRNIAIIAHVDHGKTTLVDSMFKQSGTFREGKETEERLMDSMDLERERGITIAAKNCSIVWKGIKVNILDTPGHADFGGEVERALSMVDGVLLLVDASEGPLPQTRFVLSKALAAGLSVVIVINKIDRPDARPQEVLGEVYDLLIDLDAHDDQLECPVLFADGRAGIAKLKLEDEVDNLHVLMDTIIKEIPAPAYNDIEPFQMLVTDLSYSDYLGRLAIGKVVHGHVKSRDTLVCIKEGGKLTSLNVSKLQVYEGPALKETDSASPGDIVVMAGIEDVHIGDTICTKENPKALKRITVDEPTVSMRFAPNTSPTMGQEGKFVQSSKIRERLEKETMLNVSIKVEEFPDKEGFIVKGRGEFQMVILIETMRREGFELCVGRPEVIFHHKDGKVLEPIEHLYVDCEEVYTGIVTEKLSKRKGRMVSYVNHEHGRVRLEFSVPSRALIGYRDEFLTDTRGTGIMNSLISDYEEYRGDFPDRHTGSLIADRSGEAVPYALYNLEPRGTLFITAGDTVYEGMIVGEHNRENDLNVNACKTKKLSNVRASGKDDAVVLTPVMPMTLERGIQFLREDELMEVTPKSIRLRKIVLQAMARKVNDKKN
ncbi:translational GTPase TypA [Oceanispirochaeta sp.]|jgi:GTP-binding protein|uniref:translational GTPase TypA n=1 Tax=Oceanispirochaeta sp. TaxID=2035350 RepID=UPI0026347416|nr:translational GTPase TypA [Oceanispirochaeta sp.]MDA3957489.1 translational GTPase TypA [Oceanispirochaeta sp.]